MIKCPICGNDIPSTYCAICETNLLKINGQYYSETIYKASTDLKNSLNTYRQTRIQMSEIAKKA